MRAFSEYNPIVTAAYFIAVTGIGIFCMNPIILCLSLFCAALLFVIRNGARGASSHLAYLGLFAVTALINPIVSHNGKTVLFVVNDSPITLEAVVYGLLAATMITSTLYWFRSFTDIMTSDKLLYLFGKLSPRLSLILSMSMRYVPLFSRQRKMRRILPSWRCS